MVYAKTHENLHEKKHEKVHENDKKQKIFIFLKCMKINESAFITYDNA